jgi:tetratricopeptide (TPR) repeat protein
MVLQREPDNQTALRGLVETRIQQGKLDALLDPLQRLADLNPEQPDYAVLLAQTKQRLGDREAAAELYRSTLEKHPGSINALKGLADLLLQQERPEAAISLLQDTIKTADEANKAQPGTVDAASIQLLLGETYARLDRFEEAMAIYDQASQANTQDFRPVLGKALVLKAQGNLDEAQPLFASAAALAPAQFKDQITQLAAAAPSPAPSASPAAEAPEKSAEDGSEEKSAVESPEAAQPE